MGRHRVRRAETGGGFMSVLDVVGSYYDAWMAGKGDFGAVPLAPDFAFTGPVASFDSAEGFRQMAAQAGPMVTRFSVRRQFTDGDTVCSIIDWEMALPIAERSEERRVGK